MKNSALKKGILFILCIIILLSCAVTPLYAWFVSSNMISYDAEATMFLRYFASGYGTEDEPYMITEARHVYNLAWLQDTGKLQDKKYYFELAADINMNGLAIPPIGTTQFPFVGHFEGKRKTISNLFVSNIKSELRTMFNTVGIDLGNEVGFFGRLDSRITPYSVITAGEAYNFYLENVRISSGAENTVIGIVAGFNNGTLKNIGVSKNSFKLTSGKAAASDFVLIGKVGTESEWVDSPNYFGNKILIDPNDPDNLFTTLSSASESYRTIPDSVPQHAYMTPNLDLVTAGPKNLHKIDTVSTSTVSGVLTLTPANTTTITTQAAAVAKGIPAEFYTRYSSNNKDNERYIMPKSPPNPNVTVGVPFEDGTLQIPANGIWFKPKGDGISGMAFSIYNQSANAAMSVYEYTRDAGGNIINWKETRFILPTDSVHKFKNKDILYFDFEVKNNYEYIVSTDTLSTNPAGFYYLTLGGVGYQGGGLENKSTTQRIDYVMRTGTGAQFPDLSLQEYAPNRTHLSFAGTASSAGYMYFNKTTFNSVTAVYYYSGVGGLLIKENVHEAALPQSALALAVNIDAIFL